MSDFGNSTESANDASKQAAEIQKRFYARTAAEYDACHLVEGDKEHELALSWLSAVIEQYGVSSVLDVGAGTGRTVAYLTERYPRVRVIGIEPVAELREQGYAKGISAHQLLGGDGNQLAFDDASFDLVCEFAMLHHVAEPRLVVSEMIRVAARFVFISDCNNFGQGKPILRFVKRSLSRLGLWKPFEYLRTGGKGYHISEGDGLFYSYSVFNSYDQIRSACSHVHLMGTTDSGPNLMTTAAHVALLGVKKR